MDPKELIERLHGGFLSWLRMRGHPYFARLVEQAAAALAELTEENAQLRAELERVKRERDAYEFCSKDLLSKGNCNECGSKENCTYRPRSGETVRANCPLWRGPQKEE